MVFEEQLVELRRLFGEAISDQVMCGRLELGDFS